ncbi:MAG: PspC domain-containing protein [Bacteroidales bacterium]|nr:PspC domain-containing protein [Bacteroidales bacterium]
MRRERIFRRKMSNRILGGVCSGLADYFDVDVTLVRAIVASSIIFAGMGMGLYLILWIFVPAEL